jgi:hypothetical protein
MLLSKMQTIASSQSSQKHIGAGDLGPLIPASTCASMQSSRRKHASVKPSMNFRVRRDEFQKLSVDNQAILKRLQDQKSHYDVEQ